MLTLTLTLDFFQVKLENYGTNVTPDKKTVPVRPGVKCGLRTCGPAKG